MALPGTEHQPHARAVLTPALPPGGTASHAYLFHGPAGSGKRDVARQLATALLADGAPDPANAALRVEHGTHPDLTWVTPSGAADLVKEDIEEPVVGAAAHTPFEAKRRVFVIERVDRFNDTAANRMLKTLEEPPSFVHILLLTDHLEQVMPTIASRCQLVRFDQPPVADQAARLERHGIAPDQAVACARLSLGDGEKALALALNPALRAAAEQFARESLRDELTGRPWLALLEPASAAGTRAFDECGALLKDELEVTAKRDVKRTEREGTERAKRAERRARTETLDLGLALVGLWFRDLACLADGAPEVIHHTDRRAQLNEDTRAADPGRLRQAIALVDDTRERLQLNVAEELACEVLAYRLAALLRATARAAA